MRTPITEIKKLLIANRGEIACRIVKTCNEMGIKTVGVYTTEDANSRHAHIVDEAFKIGSGQVDGYLSIPNIIKIAQENGVDAVHPGFGFLSENSNFVEKLSEVGLNFVGPNARSMKILGDKIQSKKAAIAAGIPVIPGFNSEVESVVDALQIAKDIGYPIILKAAAGGGGKGIRIVFNSHELPEMFRLAKSEANSWFADSRILIEKYLVNPRHIEIQILADKHGNAIYMPERECSMQRRHQKVIEESPSSIVDPIMRQEIGSQSIALAKSCGYDSVGTCEYLISGNEWYFLEMNTRLQVEHPVTEFVTGLDLVKEMILVAEGKKLNHTQNAIQANGYAIESRIYAENPRTFLPSSGQLKKYIEPPILLDGSVRCDSGVIEGSEISSFYDPLICKLITHGPTRLEAIDKMKSALDSFVIQGVSHNIPLLRDICTQSSFVKANYDTGFFNSTYESGYKAPTLDPLIFDKMLSVAAMIRLRNENWNKLWVGEDKTKSAVYQQQTFYISIQDSEFFKIKIILQEPILTQIGSKQLQFESDWNKGNNFIIARFNEEVEPFLCQQFQGSNGQILVYAGNEYNVKIRDETEHEISTDLAVNIVNTNGYAVRSPLPGVLISLKCKVGDNINVGDEVAVIEAMKMQNIIRSPEKGVIREVNVKVGDTVSTDMILIQFN